MYTLTVEIKVDATEDEQCKTVARKVHEAIAATVKKAPYKVSWKISATKQSESPIIQPASTSMIKKATPAQIAAGALARST